MKSLDLWPEQKVYWFLWCEAKRTILLKLGSIQHTLLLIINKCTEYNLCKFSNYLSLVSIDL